MKLLYLFSVLAAFALTFSAAAAENPERLPLWPSAAPVGDGTVDPANAFITIHPAPKPNGAAVIICPGGGYGGLVTGAEGHGIAAWLNGHGIAGIVLEYRLPKGRSEVPLLDAQRALRTIRHRSQDLVLDPNRLGIIGFSAGGHLASTAGTHFDAGDAQSTDSVERVSSRPDFMILVYPVITMDRSAHGGSRANLLGKDPTPELIERFSNEKQVTAETPPAFLTHAADDKVVVPDNSLHFYEALLAKNVPAKYLALPSGGHGLNGYKGPMWDAWQKQSIEWLAEMKMMAGE
jgi:acetyl esterase/lipase